MKYYFNNTSTSAVQDVLIWGLPSGVLYWWKRGGDTERENKAVACAVFSCAAKFDVLGITDIHTLYENILPCACK